MARYAMVDADGTVTNICEWDGESAWSPPAGITLVQCDEHVDAERGGKFQNNAFTRSAAPEAVEVAPLTQEQLASQVAALQAQLNALLARANP